jgi:mono/diheme cytochrome c family protein
MTTKTMMLAALGVMAGSPGVAQPKKTDSLPPGVTQAMVTRGKKLFEGAGLCLACHGMDGKGSIGPDLTDTVWIHHRGSFDELVAQITKGIPDTESKSGTPMPPRGGSGMNDEETRAVAAYTWSLSRRPKP